MTSYYNFRFLRRHRNANNVLKFEYWMKFSIVGSYKYIISIPVKKICKRWNLGLILHPLPWIKPGTSHFATSPLSLLSHLATSLLSYFPHLPSSLPSHLSHLPKSLSPNLFQLTILPMANKSLQNNNKRAPGFGCMLHAAISITTIKISYSLIKPEPLFPVTPICCYKFHILATHSNPTFTVPKKLSLPLIKPGTRTNSSTR